MLIALYGLETHHRATERHRDMGSHYQAACSVTSHSRRGSETVNGMNAIEDVGRRVPTRMRSSVYYTALSVRSGRSRPPERVPRIR